jgi:hypothetical protein
MQSDYSEDTIAADWSLSFGEMALIEAKAAKARLGFGVLLRFRRLRGRFPRDRSEIPTAALAYVAEQIGGSVKTFERYDLNGRSSRRHRIEILDFMGLKRLTQPDRNRAVAWMMDDLCPQGLSSDDMIERAIDGFNAERVACPGLSSTVNTATENITYVTSDGTAIPGYGIMPGGGTQTTPAIGKIGPISPFSFP